MMGLFFLLVLISCLYHCRYFEVEMDTPPPHNTHSHPYKEGKEGGCKTINLLLGALVQILAVLLGLYLLGVSTPVSVKGCHA